MVREQVRWGEENLALFWGPSTSDQGMPLNLKFSL